MSGVGRSHIGEAGKPFLSSVCVHVCGGGAGGLKASGL